MSNLGFHCHNLEELDEVTTGNGLRRGEFYNLPREDVQRLRTMVASHGLHWSIHSPLVQLDWYPKPPTWSFLCDPDRDRRELTIRMVSFTLAQAEDLGAEYVVVHLPSPTAEDGGENLPVLRDTAMRSCEHLAELSLRRSVPVHIEGVGQSPLIEAGFLTEVLEEFDPLRYCFDTAHAGLAARHNGFDVYEFEARILPYIGSVHLWNIRDRDDYLKYGHVPVHPGQSAGDGWVDIERALRILDNKRNSVPIIFESRPEYPEELGGYDYREGVQWVKELLAA